MKLLPLFYMISDLVFHLSLGTTKWGLVHGMVDEIDKKFDVLKKRRWSGVPKAKKKRVNASSWMNDIDYNDDPVAFKIYEADPALSYGDENPEMRKQVKLHAEINECSDDSGRCGSKMTTSFQMMLKNIENKKNIDNYPILGIIVRHLF